ncbi:MAG TPA: reverse transcriptase-like protein [Candidatus Acidoferrales bacterium]
MSRSNKMAPPASVRLFSESQPVPPSGVSVANIDGASRGNPGPASYAVVIRDPSGKIILELAKKLGRETNNVAEYYALLAALDYAISRGISALRIRSDSELLVRQIQGRYKIKSAQLKPLYERATKLVRQLSYFAIEHVRREQNREADALANVALDSGSVVSATDVAAANQKHQGHESRPSPSGAIKARFVRGVLVPNDPLDLPEGSEVSLTLHRLPRQ